MKHNLVPFLLYTAAPEQSAKLLKASQACLERNNRAIAMAVSSIFGVYFLHKGITGLAG